MKAIKRIIISLVVIVAVLGVVVIGGYIYVRSAYGIDLFRTAGQLKTLTEQVNEAELCPNAYGDSDFVDLKNSVNAEIEGLVKFEEGKGYNGYTLDFNALIGANISKTIALSEKQVGALAQTVFFEQTGGKIQLGGKQTDVTIVQTDFSEIAENGSAESVNLQIGTIAVNALIGNEQSVGFAYSLKAVGATTFYFANVTTAENSIDCFMVV